MKFSQIVVIMLAVFRRNIIGPLKEALGDTPVVLLIGARQSGKSTLVQNLSDDQYKPQYLTFDDVTQLAAASDNPKAYLDSVSGQVIFDEIQRVPELFLTLKENIDRDRSPGRFLLTGSANVLVLPKVADSLVGRMEVITLRPLSQGEIIGRRDDFIDWVCGDDFRPPDRGNTESRETLFNRMFTGGFPEAVQRHSAAGRSRWFRSYITTLLQRDVRDLANIEGAAGLPRLLALLAAKCGGLVNFADISRTIGMPQTTLKRYTAMFEQLFMIEFLPAYSGNLTKRLTRSSKLYFADTGILAHLQGLNWQKISLQPAMAGMVMENFVVGELRKQSGWSDTKISMFHFRTAADDEVDIVLELPGGEIVGIEVKSAASVGSEAFKGLKVLRVELGPKIFKRGIVLYTGNASVAFDNDLFAMPLSSLWSDRKNGLR